MVDACLQLLELGYFELKIAFEGLADAHTWQRPAPGLLSVGELAGHLAYWEAVRLAGDGPDPAQCRLRSPLIDLRFRYYQQSLANPPTERHRAMTADQVLQELLRVHSGAIAQFQTLSPDPNSRIPGCPTGFTYGEYLQYAVFHTAYHTGQIYSVRHLLGEETPDN
jgi:hypothetical protein